MGFRKPLYDVEEKGLDPEVPHTNLGSDGRLLPAEENLGTPTAVSSSKKTNLDKVEVEAVTKAKENAAKTPQPAEKAKEKAVDKPQNAIKELPDEPKADKKSSTKKKVTRTRKTAPKAKAKKKISAKKSSTTSSKAKTTRKKDSS